MESRKQYKFTCALFGVYFVALIWIILFKTQFSFEKLRGSGEINLIPFAGSAIVNGKIQVKEIIENILVFVPFGIYMPMLKMKWPVWKKTVKIINILACVSTVAVVTLMGVTIVVNM